MKNAKLAEVITREFGTGTVTKRGVPMKKDQN